MFNLNYTTPSSIKGTIKVRKPIYSLGIVADINGDQWHIEAIIGKTVCAVPLNQLHPYYRDTSGSYFGLVSQKWEPYSVEVIE